MRKLDARAILGRGRMDIPIPAAWPPPSDMPAGDLDSPASCYGASIIYYNVSHKLLDGEAKSHCEDDVISSRENQGVFTPQHTFSDKPATRLLDFSPPASVVQSTFSQRIQA